MGNFTSYPIEYQNVRPLWKGTLLGLKQYELSPVSMIQIKDLKSLKFGYAIEHILQALLQHSPSVRVLCSNLQINSQERTLGEFDFIISDRGKLIHLETACKFYLYDPENNRSELSEWIGPNQKDSLLRKLNRIKDHQLPLIKTSEAQKALSGFGIESTQLDQQVIFRAVLFLPHFHPAEINISPLNEDAICGTYFHYSHLNEFKESKFYWLVHKLDWIIEPHTNVDWITLSELKTKIRTQLENQNSVYIWKKDPKGLISRHFITWW